LSSARLDVRMVELALAPSRERAQSLIRAGQVLVDERVVDKPGTKVAEGATLRVRGEDHPYVSRGGVKLAFGLAQFGLSVEGCVCADLGASTGGFTDCLLQHGARKVYAVDVGYGQLAWKIRTDPRVVAMERTNARHLEALPEPIDVIVADLSFISLPKVAGAMLRIAVPRARGILLVKPQFEVGPGRVGKGGVVREAEDRALALNAVCNELERLGIRVLGHVESPLLGAKAGNHEFLVQVAFT
jgi:23S rRNA (cytidine1920-2'-O)/16S rRNA (cytidine1409-2'-O)-methyltransferase